ncbi:MAG: glycosyltransferase family 2 protein [Deltaproteobacteria bacterium]|nr:glycosyltransferase family 2 protein [Deltaproteobacteria bacterium]
MMEMEKRNEMGNNLMKNDLKLSIIVPVFNEEINLMPLMQRLMKVLDCYLSHEILFVDDGSTDGTLDILRTISRQYPFTRYLSFSRNFGHQSALRAGLMQANGDCVISLDADLQHPPEMIPEMISRWQEGYDIVVATRSGAEALPFLKKVSSRLYYRILNSLSDIHFDEGAADFRLLDRKVVLVLRQLSEQNLFLRGIVNWVGFRKFTITYEQEKRLRGASKYSIHKMVQLGMQGITAFSVRPLRLATFMGLIIAGLAVAYTIYALIMYVFTSRAVAGWTSLIVSILFLGGIQMFLLGIIGEYLGRLFIDSKRRPDYIIREEGP